MPSFKWDQEFSTQWDNSEYFQSILAAEEESSLMLTNKRCNHLVINLGDTGISLSTTTNQIRMLYMKKGIRGLSK